MPNVSKTHDNAAAGFSAAEIDQRLRRGYFVKRGDIMAAFGLTRDDMDALVPEVFHPAPLPATKTAGGKVKRPRHRFVRSQVMEIARQWERARV